MIRKVVSFSLYQPLFIVLGLVLFIGGGIAAFNSLPVEAFPDVTDTQVTVITLYPGRAAEEVEKQITIPLEVALSGLPNAVRMFAHTQFGLGRSASARSSRALCGDIACAGRQSQCEQPGHGLKSPTVGLVHDWHRQIRLISTWR